VELDWIDFFIPFKQVVVGKKESTKQRFEEDELHVGFGWTSSLDK
jgi:hypothetical protein